MSRATTPTRLLFRYDLGQGLVGEIRVDDRAPAQPPIAAPQEPSAQAYEATWDTVCRWAERQDMPTWQPIEWRQDPRRRRSRALAWACDAFAGVVIRHCGHPTALRPYYICGLAVARKFSNLRHAQAAVAAIAAGAIEEVNL